MAASLIPTSFLVRRLAAGALALCLGALLPLGAAQAERIKDLASFTGVRENQLIGYGLVIGLQGSGDGLRNSPFTEQSIRAMLQNLGIAMEGGQARARNVAAACSSCGTP